MLNKDFREFVEFLIAEKAEFLIVGGYALAAYGHPRYTGALDIWIRPTSDDVDRVLAAHKRFGFGETGIEASDLTTPGSVVQLGYPPLRIDLLTTIDGVDFDDCYPKREIFGVDGLSLPFIGLDDFKANKRAAGRAKDRADLESLGEEDPD